MLPLNDLAREVHDNAVKHKWWDDLRNFGEVLALIHSEASEALEEWRNHHDFDEVYYSCSAGVCGADEGCPHRKPEGIPIEMADIIIRTLDACAAYGINITEAMAIKMEYNKTRPERHGGKRA